MNVANPQQTQAVLALRNVRRTYQQGHRKIHVLDGAAADIFPGEAVALVGPSGAGKSTLLHIAGLLETPDAGHVIVHGQDCAQFNDTQRTRVRRNTMGFVYQFHQLLPEFSAIENVAMPQMIQGRSRKAAIARAKDLLSVMGLAERFNHRPPELSGGEQQRTAICRALANEPSLLLADEPTGNLDPRTSERVFEALMNLVSQTRVSALIATHNMELAGRMTRTLRMADGQLVDITAHGAF
ncbi:MAG: ABC transporter ATP-binding protein [Pseudomonadota bacterium]